MITDQSFNATILKFNLSMLFLYSMDLLVVQIQFSLRGMRRNKTSTKSKPNHHQWSNASQWFLITSGREKPVAGGGVQRWETTRWRSGGLDRGMRGPAGVLFGAGLKQVCLNEPGKQTGSRQPKNGYGQ